MILRVLVVALSFCLMATQIRAEENIQIGYLEQIVPRPPILSNLDEIPENEGFAGAEIGLSDNTTTGKFLGHNYALQKQIIEEGGDVLAAAQAMLKESPYLLLNAPQEIISQIAKLPEAENALLFNVSSRETKLRGEACSANLLHTMPSRTMLSDALAQFSVKKRWSKWALIHGAYDADKSYLAALEKSAKKFGVAIVEKKQWNFDADMRRNAAQEVPLFTQDFPNHDMMVIADERGDFGRYVIYNTWIPRPIAGSEGVVPSAWSASVEQHGAAQLQSRFYKEYGRQMRPIDYAAWAAVRTVGEAVTRTNSADLDAVKSYILSDEFALGGFKGRPLTYRKWNGQMRQPIVLSHARAVVAIAPLDGFLHQRNELDTLGLDQAESFCATFTE